MEFSNVRLDANGFVFFLTKNRGIGFDFADTRPLNPNPTEHFFNFAMRTKDLNIF